MKMIETSIKLYFIQKLLKNIFQLVYYIEVNVYPVRVKIM